MKIVLIGSYPLNSACINGGVEASVYGLVHELGKKHNVVVFDLPRKKGNNLRENNGNIVIVRSSNNCKTNIEGSLCFYSLFKQILVENPEVCHIHGTGMFTYFIFKKLKKHRIPVLLTVHGLVHVEKKKALQVEFSIKKYFQFLYQSFFEGRLLSSCRDIIVDTEYVKKEVQRHLSNTKKSMLPKIAVIPQGINDAFFEMESSRNSNVILSVGVFSSRKGHLQLLDAFDMVAKKIPDIKLVIAGGLSSKDYYEKMRKKVEESPYENRIRLMPNIESMELMDLYRNAHVFVLHSKEESQGIVLAEAMAVGLPVVATNVGGIPDVVKDGESGFLTDYSDTRSFADSIIALMKDSALWDHMSQTGKTLSVQYHWGTITQKIEEIYKGLINS